MGLHFIHTRFIIILLMFISITTPKNAFGLLWYSPPIDFVPTPNGINVDLSVDPLGNAFTAYIDYDGIVYNASVTRFSDFDEGYQPPVTLATSSDIPAITVATGITGTAVCIWQDGNIGTLESAYYNGSSWTVLSPPIFSGIPPIFVTEPDVQMNSLGNAIVTWSDPSVLPGDIYASFFDGGTQTWSSPTILSIGGTGGSRTRVAFNTAGDAMVIWIDPSNQLQSSYYNGTLLSWGAPIVIATDVQFGTYSVGIDSAGNAIAVWQNSSDALVYGNYYDRALNLFFPQSLTIGIGGRPRMGMTPSGNGFVAWSDGSNGFYNEYRIAMAGWTGAVPIPVVMGGFLVLGLDSSGNALIIYPDNATPDTMSIYKPFDGSFQTPNTVASSPDEISPIVAGLADNGRGFVDGASHIIVGLGISGTYTIIDVSGRACFDPNGGRVRFLSWSPFRDPDIVAYYLKRNSTLIAVNLATQPRVYVDEDRNANITDVYTIIAVDASGNELSKRRIALR